MKRIISLLLALSMLLALCACGQSSEIKSAAAMMEAGDYEGALATLTRLEADEEITAMIAECENAIAYDNAVNLVNEGKYGEAREIFSAIADYKDVSDYLAKYKTVAITTDNWNEYFEMKEADAWLENDFGEISDYTTTRGFFIKENYDKLILLDDSDAAFEYKLDSSFHRFSVDFENKTTKIGRKDNSIGYADSAGTFNLHEGYRMTYDPHFPQEYCLWEFGGGYYNINDNFSYITLIVNDFSILRAEGTLTYYEP